MSNSKLRASAIPNPQTDYLTQYGVQVIGLRAGDLLNIDSGIQYAAFGRRKRADFGLCPGNGFLIFGRHCYLPLPPVM